jgi:hypothetical protein
MKTHITHSLLAAAAVCSLANAETAYTTPVGYITHTIAGSSDGAGADTFLSPSLIQTAVFQGTSSSAPASTTLSFSGGVPTDLDATYVLEITSGDSEGWWSTVTSSTATSVSVSDEFPQSISGNVTVSVRKHNTVRSFLGANSPGLTVFDGVSTAEEVQILNPSTQAATIVVYVSKELTGADQDGWYDLSSSTLADDMVIEPGSAIKVVKYGSSISNFVSSGEVKLTKTQVDIYPDSNWVGTPLAGGGTLDFMQYATQLVTFDGANTDYDELQFINSDQTATIYSALDPALGAGNVMGNLADSSIASDVVFAEGTGAIIKRSSSGSASVLTIPGTVVSQ